MRIYTRVYSSVIHMREAVNTKMDKIHINIIYSLNSKNEMTLYL